MAKIEIDLADELVSIINQLGFATPKEFFEDVVADLERRFGLIAERDVIVANQGEINARKNQVKAKNKVKNK